MKKIKLAQDTIKGMIKHDLNTNINFGNGGDLISRISKISVKKITEYSLSSGKRLRPMITATISGFNTPYFPLFIEYVHNSSLIVDDLPCMDNDTERRGQTTLHTKYGEYMAQMISYNLIVTAMKHLSDGCDELRQYYNDAEFRIIQNELNSEVSSNMGYMGICGGQLLDLMLVNPEYKELHNGSPREKQELILSMIRMKTGCLFSLSFMLGWIGRGGSLDAINDIKQAGYDFGTCYQIIDDLDDVEKDSANNGGYNNICRYYTYNQIIDIFSELMFNFSTTMTRWRVWDPLLKELNTYMLDSFKNAISNVKPLTISV